MEKYDFQAGTTLLVDKPLDWTSFDVVNKIRSTIKKSLNIKKIKVGHAGTLDPKATGLLIICTGKYTKKLSEFQNLGKQYVGTMVLGATTPSFDTETEINQTFPTAHIDGLLLDKTREVMIGEIEQYPPIYSAIKVKGKPLYKHAREGEKVEIKPRKVCIYEFDFTNVTIPELGFIVTCSKGTYIRSLVYDFGKLLGSGAYLSQLQRTQIGKYRIENAWNLEDLLEHINKQAS